jgi:hypothetical protein
MLSEDSKYMGSLRRSYAALLEESCAVCEDAMKAYDEALGKPRMDIMTLSLRRRYESKAKRTRLHKELFEKACEANDHIKSIVESDEYEFPGSEGVRERFLDKCNVCRYRFQKMN